MTMLNARATTEQLREVILENVASRRNMSQSQIVRHMLEIFPDNSYYEVKYLVKEMEKEGYLTHDILYGGLRVA
jgi:hypothetical protein